MDRTNQTWARLLHHARGEQAKVSDVIAYGAVRGLLPRQELVLKWWDYEDRCRAAVEMAYKRDLSMMKAGV